MKAVYFASGISDTPRKIYQSITAKKVEDLGYTVYAAANNDSINDKSNDPTPVDIYKGDIDVVKKSDILIACISGGNEIGTISEIGMAAGWNEKTIDELIFLNELVTKEMGDEARQMIQDRLKTLDPIKIVMYTTNERMTVPQFWNGIASGGFNHLVAGMVDMWGVFVGGEDDMLEYMENLKE